MKSAEAPLAHYASCRQQSCEPEIFWASPSQLAEDWNAPVSWTTDSGSRSSERASSVDHVVIPKRASDADARVAYVRPDPCLRTMGPGALAFLNEGSAIGRQPSPMEMLSLGAPLPFLADGVHTAFVGQAAGGQTQDSHGASTAGDKSLPKATQAFREARREVDESDLAMQKRINKELTTAASSMPDCITEVLRVAAVHLHQLNGVNLSTAIHRLARACERSEANMRRVKTDSIFVLLIEMAELKAQQELLGQTDSMPGNCCTIITWSCAVLRLFQPNLFTALARVARGKLQDCQCYEVTNLLWSFAELCKRQPQMATELEADMQELVDGAAGYFLRRSPHEWKIKVLVSALVSLTHMPCKDFCTKWFIVSIVQELAERSDEAHGADLLPVGIAFDTLRTKHEKVFREISGAVISKYPNFVARYMYGGFLQQGKAHIKPKPSKRVEGSKAMAAGEATA